MPDTELCEFLSWDSDFFRMRIGRLLTRQLSPRILDLASEWRRAHQVDCLYFLASPDDAETVRLAEANAFRLVDIRITLARASGPYAPSTAPAAIRLYREGDLDLLKGIARRSHTDSRFFFDCRFPAERAETLFETWIERSCNGWAQAVFVLELDGAAAGYTTCHIGKDGAASIGLVGLAPHAQGRGFGSLLIQEAVSYFQREGVSRIDVVTQGRNVRAQRLYQKCGFFTESILLSYHQWAS